MEHGPGYEHTALRGITVKNMIVTIISTATIVASVLTTYYNMKSDIHDMRDRQDTENKITDIRLKTMEEEIKLLKAQYADFQNKQISGKRR